MIRGPLHETTCVLSTCYKIQKEALQHHHMFSHQVKKVKHQFQVNVELMMNQVGNSDVPANCTFHNRFFLLPNRLVICFRCVSHSFPENSHSQLFQANHMPVSLPGFRQRLTSFIMLHFLKHSHHTSLKRSIVIHHRLL